MRVFRDKRRPITYIYKSNSLPVSCFYMDGSFNFINQAFIDPLRYLTLDKEELV